MTNFEYIDNLTNEEIANIALFGIDNYKNPDFTTCNAEVYQDVICTINAEKSSFDYKFTKKRSFKVFLAVLFCMGIDNDEEDLPAPVKSQVTNRICYNADEAFCYNFEWFDKDYKGDDK